MSKRVYEIAREQSLENKEVIRRLQDAGVEVKSHSSSVDENVYEKGVRRRRRAERPH